MQCRLTLNRVVRKRSKVMAALENEISRLLTKGGLGVGPQYQSNSADHAMTHLQMLQRRLCNGGPFFKVVQGC